MLDVCFLFRKHAKVKLKENADRTKMLKETMAQKTVSDRESVIITIIQGNLQSADPFAQSAEQCR